MVNKRAILKRMIVLCWGLLFVCFAIKLFGANIFEIVCINEKFIVVCDFIDNNIIQFKTIQYITLSITAFLYFGCLISIKKLDIILIFIINAILILIKYFFNNINFIFESLFLIIYPIIRNRKIIKPLVYFVILNVFQILSLFIKCNGIKILSDNTLIALILLIDYYIMLILFLLYNKILRSSKMGSWGFLWFSENITQWKAYRETLKNPKAIAKVDKKIAQLEAKKNDKL